VDINLGLLETFVNVFRARTLTEAANRLGMTQPAVTAQLQRLERSMGVVLFDRSTSGVSPTADAVRLMARAAPHVDALRASTASTPATLTGTVRVGGASDVMALRIIPSLAPLLTQGLQVHATTGPTPHLLEELAAGRLDLVVSSLRPRDRAMTAVSLIDEEFLLVGSPSIAHTVDKSRLKDTAAALAHIPLLAYADDLQIIRRYWLTEFEQKPTNRVSLILPDLRGILEALIAGAGMSVLPRYVAQPALDEGRLHLLHTPSVGPLNTLYLVTSAHNQADGALNLLRTHLKEQAASWVSL